MTFFEKLQQASWLNRSRLSVGLDSDFAKLPAHLKNHPYPLFEFNRQIIEATADLVCAYKLNSAFYEALGHKGIYQLKLTFDYLNQNYPHLPTILDAKRADIGNTNLGYAQFAFEYLQADALTVNPYLGGEAIRPFLDYANKGIIVLCKTSNPGSGEIQDLLVGEQKLYQLIAQKVASEWNYNRNCLLVVGATYAQDLAFLRKTLPEMTFLIPGVGTQGGDLRATVLAAKNEQNTGFIINSSREVIFASSGFSFALDSRQKAQILRDQINSYLV